MLQRLHQIGICSSYNRVIDLLSGWAENALKVYKANDQVIPLKLRSGVFTVFTKDNIDKNSTSNETTEHFHRTSVCAFQSMISENGVRRTDIRNESETVVRDFSLPRSYTEIPPSQNKCKQYSFPLPTVNIPESISDDAILNINRIEEINWMNALLSADNTAHKSWSSYHSRKDSVSIKSIPTPCNSSILPLLKDVMHTGEMQCDLIKLCIDYTGTLNPQQVTAVDCSDNQFML